MSENKTLDENEISTESLDSNFGATGKTKDIVQKPIHICGRSTWRGKPSALTAQDKIGPDGKTAKFSCQTKESFELTINDEKTPVTSFYITELMYKQLDRLLPDGQSIDESFQEGKYTGILYVVKRKNQKPGGMSYWSFVNEKQLNEVEIE